VLRDKSVKKIKGLSMCSIVGKTAAAEPV